MNPLISVVMSTYNRESMIKESIDSILNQTFSDFEFIIIDDNSIDNTFEIIKEYNDNRIKLFRNEKNSGCTFNYHNAQNIAKGKYIAHIDDDDISLPLRLEKQFQYMEEHPEIVLLGSFIETFGENVRPSWVFYTDPLKLDFSMNFYNPLCHSSIMYRKSFVEVQGINYDISKKCAQDYDFYKQIIKCGGRLANIPNVLVRYRMHSNRLTDIKNTQDVQIQNAENIINELQARFLSKDEITKIKDLMYGFPFNKYDKNSVIEAVEIMENALKTTFFDYRNAIKDVKEDIKNDLFIF